MHGDKCSDRGSLEKWSNHIADEPVSMSVGAPQ